MTKTRNKFLGLFALAAGALSLGAFSIADAHPGHTDTTPSARQLYGVAAYAPATTVANDEVPTPTVKVRDHRGNKRVAMADRPGQTGKAAGKANRAQRKAQRKQARQNRRAKVLSQYDANQNGSLDPEEKLALRKDRFDKLDANKDGTVTKAELQAKLKERRAKIQERRKANGRAGQPLPPRAKQKLAKRKAKMAQRFAKLDADKSGGLSWEEFKSAPMHKGKAKKGRRGMRNGKGMHNGRGMRRGHQINPKQ